ncbi:hypothetical protein NOR51B_1734 [Luminiphilus syltensis NOR5-1B]|uniref:EthD domain-containing protein n=1 Tax=Luminiphilus syltensis NOR5-1B TaxID=565045 RepID=B8KS31_9GAMM|nr:EthD domain-containing protein [Luminiphilus syltensis]EED35787.1 hypothetical protein NOR51B_1734 [Luminiphilus syltensis NOR5-1B]
MSRDDYRAAHIGYHSSCVRRLKGLRGYLVNIRAESSTQDWIADTIAGPMGVERDDVATDWDGLSQLFFDSIADYRAARALVQDRPGPAGLERDERLLDLGGDEAFLYSTPPLSFAVDEHVVLPVRRPEHKVFKLVQLGRKKEGVSDHEFRSAWCTQYADQVRAAPGLLGYTVNFPQLTDVKTDFYPPGSSVFSPQATERELDFHRRWDGYAELWFTTPEHFVDWRSTMHDALRPIEAEWFDHWCYVEVDETVVVLPDRSAAAPFYHR